MDRRRTHPGDTLRTVLAFEYADRIWHSNPRHAPGSKPIPHRKYALYLAGKMVPEDKPGGVIDDLNEAVPGSALPYRSLLWPLLRGERLDPDELSRARAEKGMGELGSGFRELAEIERLVIETEIDLQLAEFGVVEARIESTRKWLRTMPFPRIAETQAEILEGLLRAKTDEWDERLVAMRGIAETLGPRLAGPAYAQEQVKDDGLKSRKADDVEERPRERSELSSIWLNRRFSAVATLVLLVFMFITKEPFQQVAYLLVMLVNLACATNRRVFDLSARSLA